MSAQQLSAKKQHKQHSDERRSSNKRKREVQARPGAPESTQESPTKKSRHGYREIPESMVLIPALERLNEDTVTQEPTPPPEDPVVTPFHTQTTSFYLALSPIGQSFPLESLCAEHLSPLILTYYPPLKGVVLAYSNPRLSNHPGVEEKKGTRVLARSIDEYAVTYVWLTADFTVLKPEKGVWIEGYVSVQSESQLGLVCWNLFNASIERKRLPKKWRWVGSSSKPKRKHGDGQEAAEKQEEAEGHFVDGDGVKVEDAIRFRVRDLENLPEFGSRDKGFMSFEGTLLNEEDDEKVSLGEKRLGRGVHGMSVSVTHPSRRRTQDKDRGREK